MCGTVRGQKRICDKKEISKVTGLKSEREGAVWCFGVRTRERE